MPPASVLVTWLFQITFSKQLLHQTTGRFCFPPTRSSRGSWMPASSELFPDMPCTHAASCSLLQRETGPEEAAESALQLLLFLQLRWVELC